MIISSILSIALATAAQAEKPWEVVTSREGNFTVEMPARPNRTSTRTERVRGGRKQITEIVCDRPDGSFVVAKVEDPVVIPKALEEAVLDLTRDWCAERFHGKVISDKKVRVDMAVGRDFAIRAQPDPKIGVVTIRAREYLNGKAVIVLVAASEPGQELSPDAARFLGSFAFGSHPGGTTVKADARETEAVGKDLAGWGMAIDPDGDCKITTSGSKSLTMEVPGTLHDLVADIGKFNAPPVLKKGEGDFVAMVRVDGPFQPGTTSTKARTVPLHDAGLMLWKDAQNYIFLQRFAMLGKGGKINPVAAFEEREAGHRGATHNLAIPPGAVLLRLERKGPRVIGAVSNDGVEWKALKPIDTTWRDGRIKVGLVAVNTSSGLNTVKFESYSLKSR